MELKIRVHSGRLPLKACSFAGGAGKTAALLGTRVLAHRATVTQGRAQVLFAGSIAVEPGQDLQLKIS
jgi:hypothetical protein